MGGAVRPWAQMQKGKVKVGSCGSSYLIAFISLRFGEAKSRAENGEGDLRIRHGRIIWEGGREHGVWAARGSWSQFHSDQLVWLCFSSVPLSSQGASAEQAETWFELKMCGLAKWVWQGEKRPGGWERGSDDNNGPGNLSFWSLSLPLSPVPYTHLERRVLESEILERIPSSSLLGFYGWTDNMDTWPG